ncbi:gem-associated protein 7-like [Leptopilina boulardi]|uniref:gem-associated protein 7-like n=1 Tax=Leptopilina boulardi TaxID=63433 RepID=UPI0021F64928|nr:gem-associated protein 7-like [Leptopilina boulardi]
MKEDHESNLNENIIDVKYNFATKEKQEARSLLRERFLRVITGVVGKETKFFMHENTKVSAEFRGCDTDCLEIFVRNLTTPLGKIPAAILRSTDIIFMEIEQLTF